MALPERAPAAVASPQRTRAPHEVSAGEATLEYRLREGARPPATEDAGAPQAHRLRLGVAQGLAQAAQQTVGGAQVDGLGVEAQVGATVRANAGRPERASRTSVRRSATSITCSPASADHRNRPESGWRPSGATGQVHRHAARDLAGPAAGPAQGHLARGPRAQPRGAPVEDHGEESLDVGALQASLDARRAGPSRPRAPPRRAPALPPRVSTASPVRRRPFPSQAKSARVAGNRHPVEDPRLSRGAAGDLDLGPFQAQGAVDVGGAREAEAGAHDVLVEDAQVDRPRERDLAP